MDTSGYKQKLGEEKAKLETELLKVGRKNPANPTDWEPVPPQSETEADPIDSADITIGFDTNAAIVADLENRYNDVVAALARLEQGSFGTCEVSGESIEEERLNADPAARTCLKHLNSK
jgi:RNA polymerase-binding transcription factor DksA